MKEVGNIEKEIACDGEKWNQTQIDFPPRNLLQFGHSRLTPQLGHFASEGNRGNPQKVHQAFFTFILGRPLRTVGEVPGRLDK